MSRKLLFGFALLVCAALVGVVVQNNTTTYADDSEKAAPSATNTPAA